MKKKKYVYHGTQVEGLDSLDPKPSEVLKGKKAVFATPKKDIAVSFLVPWSDEDFTHGEHNGQMYMREMKEGNFDNLLSGQSGYIYYLDPANFKHLPVLTNYEIVSFKKEKIKKAEFIEDVLEFLKNSSFVLLGPNDDFPIKEQKTIKDILIEMILKSDKGI